MSYYMDIPDDPIIRKMERDGTLSTVDEDEEPICPVCGEACERAYVDKSGDAIGCDNCIDYGDAWDFPEYLPKQKARMEVAGW